MTLTEQGAPPLSHRNQLAEKVLLAILENATTNVRAFVESSTKGKASLAQQCLEMADAMIACQKADEEERQ